MTSKNWIKHNVHTSRLTRLHCVWLGLLSHRDGRVQWLQQRRLRFFDCRLSNIFHIESCVSTQIQSRKVSQNNIHTMTMCSTVFCSILFYLNHIYNLTSDSDPLIIATHSLKKLIWMGFLNPRYITNHLGSSWKNTRLHSRPVQSKSLGTWVLLFENSKANKGPLQLILLRSVGRELVPLLFKAGVFRAAATLGHLLDMYNIKCQPRPIESDSAISQDSWVIDVPVKAQEARSKPRKQFDSAPQPWVMLSSLGKEN